MKPTPALLFLLAAPICCQEPETSPKTLRPKTGGTVDAGELNLRMTPAVRAVQRAADSVVSIYIVHKNGLTRRGSEGYNVDGQGSGVILDESGLVITNWHVISFLERADAFKVQIKLRSGKSYFADLLSSSAEWDLALLQLQLPQGEKVKPITLGDSDSLMIGEDVLAIGNPQGNDNTVSRGILSASSRSIEVMAPDGRRRAYSGLLQTDAAINPGNSGGALLDITGRLIGINNAMAQGAENIGFAIPVNKVREVFETVLTSAESLAKVWTGFRVKDVDGRPKVADIDPRGPAVAIDLAEGDVVIEAGGQKVTSAIDFVRKLARSKAGERLSFVVERRGHRLEKSVVPLTVTAFELMNRVGFELEEERSPDVLRRATKAFVEGFGLSRYRNQLLPIVLRVKKVYPDTPASDAKVAAGDLLLPVPQPDGWGRLTSTFAVFHSAGELLAILRSYPRPTMPLNVLRGDELMEGEIAVNR